MKGQPPANRTRDRIMLAVLVIAGLMMLILGIGSLTYLTKPVAEPDYTETPYVSVVPREVNFPAPVLDLTDLDGNPVALSKNSGQVVLVNNWAFWCPPCRDELPELQAYYDAHRQQGLTIIGIEAGGEKEDVDYHVKLFKLTYPVWLDPGEKALHAFQSFNLPNSFVIDKTGTVRLYWVGVIDRAMLEKYVTPLLEE